MRVLLVLMLVGLLVLGISNGNDDITIADNTGVPDNEATSSIANNSSASANITITMYTVADE